MSWVASNMAAIDHGVSGVAISGKYTTDYYINKPLISKYDGKI